MANMRHDFQNVELIDKLIGSIETGKFNMAHWDICICGHLARVADRVGCIGYFDGPAEWGRKQLGISQEQGADLFCSNLDASRADAIRVLEILRDEGVVDWVRARRDVENRELDTLRIEAETWGDEASSPIAHTLDRLCREFQSCTARLLTI